MATSFFKRRLDQDVEILLSCKPFRLLSLDYLHIITMETPVSHVVRPLGKSGNFVHHTTH